MWHIATASQLDRPARLYYMALAEHGLYLNLLLNRVFTACTAGGQSIPTYPSSKQSTTKAKLKSKIEIQNSSRKSILRYCCDPSYVRSGFKVLA